MSANPVEPTVIAPHTTVKGELHFSGPGMIGGRVEGSVISRDALEVSADGAVEGDIQGVLVDVQGTVNGNITAAQACRLGPTARVSGELRAANLAIAEGAFFAGQVLIGSPDAPRPVQAPAPVEAVTPVETVPPSLSRIDSLTAPVEAIMQTTSPITAPSIAPPAGNGQVRVVPQTIQQTTQRGPRIIKAR